MKLAISNDDNHYKISLSRMMDTKQCTSLPTTTPTHKKLQDWYYTFPRSSCLLEEIPAASLYRRGFHVFMSMYFSTDVEIYVSNHLRNAFTSNKLQVHMDRAKIKLLVNTSLAGR